MRPNKGGKRVVPQPGGESFLIGEAAAPSYEMPMPGKVTLVQLIPLGNRQIGEADPVMTPEEYKAYCEREGILDPDRPLIPTIEELAKLPRWAKIAFVARCAWRILPICLHLCSDAPPAQMKAMEDLVLSAENAATSGQKVETKTGPISIPRTFLTPSSQRNWARVNLAAVVADQLAREPEGLLNDARKAICGVTHLVIELSTVRTAKLVGRIRRDFDRVKNLARTERWTDDTPVSQEVFGPMWPKALVPEWAKESL